MKATIVVLMSLGMFACATDPYFRGEQPEASAPSLSSAERIWLRRTAQQIAYRPRGGAVIPEAFEIPMVKQKGVKRVEVKTFIQRLEAQ